MPDPPDAFLLATLVAVVFAAGVTNGTVGVGFAQFSAAAFALLIDPKAAIVLLSINIPITSAGQLLKQSRQGHRLPRLGTLFAGGLLGVPIGVLLLHVVPSQYLALTLGVFSISYVASSLRKVPLRVPPGREPILSPPVGLLSGICSGAVGVSGPVLISYLLALDLSASAFAFTVSSMFMAMGVVRLVGLVLSSAITPTLLALGLGLAVPALLGQQVGFWLAGRISREVFRRGVLALLFLGGLALLRRGLVG